MLPSVTLRTVKLEQAPVSLQKETDNIARSDACSVTQSKRVLAILRPSRRTQRHKRAKIKRNKRVHSPCPADLCTGVYPLQERNLPSRHHGRTQKRRRTNHDSSTMKSMLSGCGQCGSPSGSCVCASGGAASSLGGACFFAFSSVGSLGLHH